MRTRLYRGNPKVRIRYSFVLLTREILSWPLGLERSKMKVILYCTVAVETEPTSQIMDVL